jgi:glutamyl-tRNA synthetase
MNVRTRFAPSPTGFLHVGGVRTALYAWLMARQNQGKLVLRIDDTDKAREVEGAVGHIQQSLKWLGLNWDESIDIGGPYEPYIQSDRLSIYKEYAEQLLTSGFAYPDPYSEEEVEEFRAKAEQEKRPFLYRNHRPDTIEEWDGTKPLRFRVPEIKRYTWNDAVFGELSAGEDALDDFILIKSDGYPTYNFAHVVDDITMHITHVLRGQEFIASTPKFLSLYDALDQAPPVFATLPPILGESGTKKLSKRDGAKDVLDYRTDGYLPEALCNYLALLGWHPAGDKEVLTMQELIATFDISQVQKSGAQWDDDKLNFINQQHMRTLTDDEYVERGAFEIQDHAQFRKIIPLLKERAHTFGEARNMLAGELAFIYNQPSLKRELLMSKEVAGVTLSTRKGLEQSLTIVQTLSDFPTTEEVKSSLMTYADTILKEEGGRGAVLWPIRYALSGQERSPDPFTIIEILGRDESISRIASALAILGE